MFKYFKKIQNKVSQIDKIAKNPFVQTNTYNCCENCMSRTYVWIEEEIISKNFGKQTTTNPFKK